MLTEERWPPRRVRQIPSQESLVSYLFMWVQVASYKPFVET